MNLNLLFIYFINVLIYRESAASYAKLAEIFIKEATKDDVSLSFNESVDFVKRVSPFGYTAEEHTVTTDDGYILKVFRITDSCKCERKREQTPVLFLHGAFINGMSWTDAGPATSLAYLAADRCYDVWIGNFRGTKYSRGHKTLKPNSEEFWNFSMDEMGEYDVPAFVNYIKEVTESEKVDVIGYSEGASVIFMYATDKKNQDNIRVAIALAPAVYMNNNKDFIVKIISKQQKAIYKTMQELIKSSDTSMPDNVVDMKCPSTLKAGSLCRFLYEKVRNRLASGALNNLFANFPEPITQTNFIRYSQHFKKRIFQKVDLGKEKNLKKYKTRTPPQYDLSCMNVPVGIIYAENDAVVIQDNMNVLKERLPNVVAFTKVDDPLWTHFDFNLNSDIPSKIGTTVFDILEGNY